MRLFRVASAPTTLALTCSLLLGCAPGNVGPDNGDPAPPGRPTLLDGQETFTGAAKTIVDWSGAIANFYSVYQAAQALAQAMGLIDPNAAIESQLSTLAGDIDAMGGVIQWYDKADARDQRLGTLLGNVTAAYEALQSAGPTDWANWNANTISAIDWAILPDAFLAYFSPATLYGPQQYDPSVGWYAWWTTVQFTNDDLQYNNRSQCSYGGNVKFCEDGTYAQRAGLIYDWRLGVPALAQLIGLRIQLMAMQDPSFTTDHHFDPELKQYHYELQKHLAVMAAGIRCNALNKTSPYAPLGHGDWVISCADIYTGINKTSVAHFDNDWRVNGQTFNTWYQNNINPLIGVAARWVRYQQPWFQVQALVDTLYLFMHPQTELTARQGRIPAAANTGLCLDVVGGRPTSGTPVWLYHCYGGPAQHWYYNRETQKIVNPAYGKCLDVQGAQSTPGTPAQIYDCINGDDAQRWTYSFEDHALRNALGNALDIRGAAIAEGTTVWTWPFYGGPAQQWFADP